MRRWELIASEMREKKEKSINRMNKNLFWFQIKGSWNIYLYFCLAFV